MIKILSFLGFVFLLAAVLFGSYDRRLRTTLFVPEISSSNNLIGTPPRLEKEYKISVTLPAGERPLVLNTILNDILHKLVTESDWQAAHFYKKNYFVTTSEDTFIFRDIYFDTADNLLEKNQSSVRLRWRWDSENSYRDYLKGAFSRRSIPTRVEIQSKVGRQTIADGFSEVHESRMEFSKDAHPIKTYIDQGRAHLLLPLFFETLKTGRFESQVHSAAQSIAHRIHSNHPDIPSLQLVPNIVILARRHRFHLNLITPWGSGPNPNNTFIVTIDRFKGLPLPASSQWEHQIGRLDFAKAPEEVEIEIEFERNTSTLLEQEIQKLQKLPAKEELNSTRKILGFFESDHQKLAREIIKGLKDNGYELTLKDVSKPQSIRQHLDEK